MAVCGGLHELEEAVGRGSSSTYDETLPKMHAVPDVTFRLPNWLVIDCRI